MVDYEAAYREAQACIAALRDENASLRAQQLPDVTDAAACDLYAARLYESSEFQASQVFLDAIINSIADGVIIYNRTGEIIRANPAADRLLGFSVEDRKLPAIERWAPIQVTYPDGTALPPNDLPALRALRGEEMHGEMFRFQRLPADPIWVSVSAAPIRTTPACIIGAVATFTDNTERVRVAEERDRILAELEATIDAIPDGYIIYNIDGSIRRMNALADEVIGFSAEEQSLPYAERLKRLGIMTLDGRPFSTEKLPSYRALHGETVRNVPLVIKRSSRSFCITVSARPIITADGRPLGAVMEFTDIGPLVQLQQEVTRHAAELEATLSSMADGIIIYSPTGEILRTNPAAHELLDAILEKEEQEQPAPHWMSAHGELPDGTRLPPEQLPAMRALRGETVRGVVLVFTRMDQSRVWLSISSAPICTANGQLLGVAAVYTDITALHALQEQQRIYLHTISHDLRAPLTIINGHAQLLCEHLLTSHPAEEVRTLQQSTDAILRSSQRMNLMIQDLVDAARLEGAQLQLAPEAIPLARYLGDLLQRSKTLLDSARIRLQIPEPFPPVLADPARLERIVINLLSNALKYSAPDTPVTIRATATAGEVAVAVQDVGPGIDADDVPHLFERFYRTRNAQPAEGIGLGLYITKLLVEAHGGHITVASTPGAGSTFTFTLPTAVSAPPAE